MVKQYANHLLISHQPKICILFQENQGLNSQKDTRKLIKLYNSYLEMIPFIIFQRVKP